MNMISLVLTLSLAAAGDRPTPPIDLLMENAVTQDPARARSWEGTWLAVTLQGEIETVLRPIEVRLSSIAPEPGTDSPAYFYPSYTLGDHDEPLAFLVRGIDADSRFPTYELEWQRRELLPGTLVDLFFGNNEFVLQARGSAEFGDSYWLRLRDYSIVLAPVGNGREQTLWSRREAFSTTPNIRWAGDLDRDGHIDLLLELPASNGDGLHYELFLSTQAQPGDYLGKASEVDGYADGC